MVSEKSLVNRRKITIVKRMKAFLNEMMSDAGMETALLPIGDGILISRKKSETL